MKSFIPDESGPTQQEMGALKCAFAELECAVTDLNDETFEISAKQYPVATHVYSTSYFLQLSTVIIARPKGLFIPPHLKTWSRLTRNVVILAVGFAIICVWALAEVIWPRIFDTTAREDSIDYEFASPHYAAEFYELNEAQVLKPDL